MREEQFIREGLEVHFEVVNEAEAIVPAFLRQIELAGPPATGDEDITGKF